MALPDQRDLVRLGRCWLSLPWAHPSKNASAQEGGRAGDGEGGGFEESIKSTGSSTCLLHALPLLHLLGGGGEGLPVYGHHLVSNLQKAIPFALSWKT